MAYEQHDNSGTLFTNDRKDKDSHPDFKGTAMIDGVVYWVSGWTKSGRRGEFTSMAFKRKDEQVVREGRTEPAQTISQQAQAKIRAPDPISSGKPGMSGYLRKEDMDDEIPFSPEFR